MTTPRTELNEIDIFVKERPKEALDYLKLLKEEVVKTNQSRTWYTYLTWLLIGAFFLLDTNSAQIHIQVFEKIDSEMVIKLLPAATVVCYYSMLCRFFLFRERMAIFDAISSRLFPSDFYPYSSYIMPGHFMLAERLLNKYRPKEEVFGNNAMLALIAIVTINSPAVLAIYEFVKVVSHYGFDDGLIIASLIIGFVFAAQCLVVKRGWDITAAEEKSRTGKIHPDFSIYEKNTSEKQ